MKATAARTSTSNPRSADVRNLNDLGSLIERADDLVALIARNRAARAGLGRTGRAVLRDHERQLDAELAGIRELASHRSAASTVEALFQIVFAASDLNGALSRAKVHGDADLVAVLDRMARLLDGARYGLDQLGQGAPVWKLSEHVAPVTEGPHSRAAAAMGRIETAEAHNG